MTSSFARDIKYPLITTKCVKCMGGELYLSCEILKRHHATIDVKNLAGNGVCFRIVFANLS